MRFDPNLLIDKDTAIQNCRNYLSENLERIKRLSKKLSKDKKNKGTTGTIAINDVIDEIYVEYDNFKWNPWNDGYLNREEFMKYGEKIGHRSELRDMNTASDYVKMMRKDLVALS